MAAEKKNQLPAALYKRQPNHCCTSDQSSRWQQDAGTEFVEKWSNYRTGHSARKLSDRLRPAERRPADVQLFAHRHDK